MGLAEAVANAEESNVMIYKAHYTGKGWALKGEEGEASPVFQTLDECHRHLEWLEGGRFRLVVPGFRP